MTQNGIYTKYFLYFCSVAVTLQDTNKILLYK